VALVVHGYKIGVTVATWLRDLIEIAHGVLILAGCVVVVCAIPLVIATRRAWADTRAALGRTERDLLPLLRELTGLARDLTTVTKTVRSDVELVHGTVADVNTRVQSVVRIAERRVGELDALLGVAQEEAEGILLMATAAARGVRAGAEALGNIVGVHKSYRDGPSSEEARSGPMARTPSGNGPRAGEPRAARRGRDDTVTHDSGDLGDADEHWRESGHEREAPRVGPRRRGR
jgi:hypothetical protein